MPQFGDGQPVARQLHRELREPRRTGGGPVFQSTTVSPPSGSAKTASIRPRTPRPAIVRRERQLDLLPGPGWPTARPGTVAGARRTRRRAAIRRHPHRAGRDVEQRLAAEEPLEPAMKGGATPQSWSRFERHRPAEPAGQPACGSSASSTSADTESVPGSRHRRSLGPRRRARRAGGRRRRPSRTDPPALGIGVRPVRAGRPLNRPTPACSSTRSARACQHPVGARSRTAARRSPSGSTGHRTPCGARRSAGCVRRDPAAAPRRPARRPRLGQRRASRGGIRSARPAFASRGAPMVTGHQQRPFRPGQRDVQQPPLLGQSELGESAVCPARASATSF